MSEPGGYNYGESDDSIPDGYTAAPQPISPTDPTRLTHRKGMAAHRK